LQISLPESKAKLSKGRPRRKLQDNIKMELTETKYNVKVWTGTRYSQITDLLELVAGLRFHESGTVFNMQNNSSTKLKSC
jgi:hypothetical protein